MKRGGAWTFIAETSCLTHELLTCLVSSDASLFEQQQTVLPQLHIKVPSKSTQLPLSKMSPFKKF